MFGVGRRDDSFVQGGLTHLVEHLVMRRVGRTALDVNASVDLTTTEFFATGSPAAVVEHLRQVCIALTDLPLDQLAVEVNVLRAEDGQVLPGAVGALMSEVYGARGAGLAGFQEPALQALTADDVSTWAQRWFTRQNAALWLSGPVPEDLALPLPDGPRPEHDPQPQRDLATPAWTTTQINGHVAVGAHLARRDGGATMLQVLRDRVEDELRHRRGLSYTIMADRPGVTDEARFVYVTADVREGQEQPAARLLWHTLVQLATDGPTADELTHVRTSLAEYLADPLSYADEVRAFAAAEVTGIRAIDRDQLLADLEAVDGIAVQAAAASFRDAAVLAVPHAVELDLRGVVRLPEWSPDIVTGRRFVRRRRRGDAPRGAELVVGEDGATLLLSPKEPITVRWDDVAGLLGVAPEEWRLLGTDGLSFPLAAGDWRDGDEALALIRARVPTDLQVAADGMQFDGNSLLLLHAPPHTAREAISMSGKAAELLSTRDWTVVRTQEDPIVHASAISGGLGRKRWLLLLEEQHGELGYALFRFGQQRHAHRWGGTPGDAVVLASALGIAVPPVANLLASTGTVDQLLAQTVAVLGLPAQVPALLRGEPVEGLERQEALGLMAGMKASVRGEFEPVEESAKPSWDRRWAAWEKRRPPSFRLMNAVSAVACGVLSWRLAAAASGDLTSWSALFSALAGAGTLSSLWSTRPPSRKADYNG